MLHLFRLTSILEGLSYLALFAFTMPLKYWAKIPEPNIYVGYVHGGLFILYIILALVVWKQKKWSFKMLLILLVASLLPFATFYVESRYLKPLTVR